MSLTTIRPNQLLSNGQLNNGEWMVFNKIWRQNDPLGFSNGGVNLNFGSIPPGVGFLSIGLMKYENQPIEQAFWNEVRVELSTPGLLINTHAGSQKITIASANNTVLGGADADTFDVETNTDGNTLFGNAGNDTMRGGAGAEIMRGGKDFDHITGNEGNDTLFGDLGNDNVDGGDGDDLIFGGNGSGREQPNPLPNNSGIGWPSNAPGIDTMKGGAGNDTFYVGSNQPLYGIPGDLITDFTVGEDKLAFSEVAPSELGSSYDGNLTHLFEIGLSESRNIEIARFNGAFSLDQLLQGAVFQ